ncbi:hypothetical protein XENOCAPTIV_017176, partial [Xenoophorus captivus]
MFYVFKDTTDIIFRFFLVCQQQIVSSTHRAEMASAVASAPRATHLTTKVELTISCENLMDMDVLSKSDPLCALYINASGSHWYEV